MRLFKRKINDPIFGELIEHRKQLWVGDLYFQPSASNVTVTISADSNGPTDEQRNAYMALVSSYVDLEASIHKALFDEYKMVYRAQLEERERPRIDDSTEIMSVMSLFRIWIRDSIGRNFELYFDTPTDNAQGDHCFVLGIRDLVVKGAAWEG